MNTGIGDAVNLGWKLAAVIGDRAAPALLDSYEPERIAFARRLVATTDRVFQAVVAGGLTGAVVRGFVMPQLVPAVTSFGAGRRAVFRTVSQIGIAYPDSPLSSGRAGDIDAGDRLPWVPMPADADNFAGLTSLGWQLQVHGTPAPPLVAAAAKLALPLGEFAWSAAAKAAGFARDAAYLVRPDMHVGLALADQDATKLHAYVAQHGLRFGA